MDAKFKRIEDKLDKIVDTQITQAVTLAKLTVSVEDHVHRSNIQDESITMLRKDVEPVKKHVAMVEGAAKLIALVGILATIVEVIHMLFR